MGFEEMLWQMMERGESVRGPVITEIEWTDEMKAEAAEPSETKEEKA